MLNFTRHLFLSLCFLLAGLMSAAPVQADHTTVELIAEHEGIVPGERFEVALRFVLDPHWHIYWKNPGANGLAPEIEWTLPEGITAGEIQWPNPERIELEGMVNYGYEAGAVVFLVTMQAADSLQPGETVSLGASLFWLICKEACVPGDANLELSLPVVAASALEPSDEAPTFAAARESLARPQSPWELSAYLSDSNLVLVLEGSDIPSDLYFYADLEGQIDPSAAQTLSYPAENRAELLLPLDTPFFENQPEVLHGLLQSGTSNWLASAEIAATAPPVVRQVTLAGTGEDAGFEQRLLALGLPGFLALSFLGGLILNIMPCVLPVLSLKVFSLLKHAGQTRRDALRHGLAYTAGVVLSFLALAGVLFALRALGERVGWGFQLQSPGFVVVLTAVFFLFGLNLMGVFELGGKLVGADAQVAKRNDVIGSFGMGILAAVVGAPCMGPLVAGVSGLAVQASITTGLLIFGMMGLGLASPFLLLSVFPKLVAFLPKPGLWMESFKQGMGFLLMAAVVFLALVAGRQGGVDAILILLVIMLLSAVAAWIFGRWGAPVRSRRSRWIAKLLALALVVGSLVLGVRATKAAYEAYGAGPAEADADGQWAEWSEAQVEALLAEGRPVFVDFTATWCLICQVNKKVALHTDATTELFAEKGIVALEADWTRYDPVITDALERFGRSGVPLYLLYTPNGEVTVLPQSLTNGNVRAAVEKALP
jgi:thiol:disulfide interchange protein DsbD